VPFAVPLLLVANVDFAVLVKIMFYYGLLEFTMLLVCFTGFYFVFTRFSGCGLIYICPLRPPCSNSASMITKTLYMLGHSLCNFIQMPGLQDRELLHNTASEEKKSPEPIATANRKHRSQQQRALLGKLKI